MILGSTALMCSIILVFTDMHITCSQHNPIHTLAKLSSRQEEATIHSKNKHSFSHYLGPLHDDIPSTRCVGAVSLGKHHSTFHKAQHACFTKHVKRKNKSNHRKKARLKAETHLESKVRARKHLSIPAQVNNMVKPSNISYSIILDDHINSKEYIKWDNGSFTMTTNHLEEPAWTSSLRPEERLEESQRETSWPVKNVAVVEGDVVVGGLMMVHSRSEKIKCGPVMAQGGIQALETMLYTLDVINARKDKKITIGAHILDDCDTDTYGLEMALDFIKGKI
ncbi:hypothetical protein M8J77_024124 [Diaphorina citri]|nr:hypothetical protein M8J77_024124 [Diaphorina citri]